MITLSTVKITPNFNILFPPYGIFWSTSLNTFIFPWGMMTPIFLNVATIIGLPSGGKDVHSHLNYLVADHGYMFYGAYSTFLNLSVRTEGKVSDAEHETFLMYFLSKYFLWH